jgi:hypothetical protein
MEEKNALREANPGVWEFSQERRVKRRKVGLS